RPSPVQERLVAAGRLGRKTGAGFYRYDEGRRGPVDPEVAEGAARERGPERVRDRIEAAVADEARLAIDEQVASQDDIRLALRLGASYPDRALDALSEREAYPRAARVVGRPARASAMRPPTLSLGLITIAAIVVTACSAT